MPLKFETANGSITVTGEDGSGDAAVTFPRGAIVQATHTGNVSVTGDLTTVGNVSVTGDLTTVGNVSVTGDLTTVGSASVTGEFIAGSYNETYAALSGTSPAVNCHNGNVFALSTTGSTTFTFTNPPASGTAFGFTLKLTAGGTYTITWPTSVDWAGGTAPDAPASGETNVLAFITYDGGVTWYGFQAGDAMS